MRKIAALMIFIVWLFPQWAAGEETTGQPGQESAQPKSEGALSLAYNLAVEYQKAGELDKAVEYYTKTIELDPEQVEAYWNRANIYYQQKKYNLAMADYQKLTILAPQVAGAFGQIGWISILVGKPDEAREASQKAHELDPEHFNFAVNLGHTYLLTGDFEKAREYYKKAIPLIKTGEEFAKGPIADFEMFIENRWKAEASKREMEWMKEEYEKKRQVDEAEALNQKALELYKAGKYEEAILYVLKAIEVGKKILPEEHPLLSKWMNNLAMLYASTGNYAKAEPLYRSALEAGKKTLGEEHPGLAIHLNNLAMLYVSMGKYTEAEPLYRKALEIGKKALGEEHPDIAIWMNNLAMVYVSMEEYAEAEPLYRRALEIGKKTLGEEHPDVAIWMNSLAGLYKTMGNYAEAEPLYRRALEIGKKAQGEGHPDVGVWMNSLAMLYVSMGNYTEAEPLFKSALSIAESSGEPELLWHVQDGMSHLLEKQGSTEAAIFFGKLSINTIQGIRVNGSKMGTETQKSFLQTKEDIYRRLANLLIDVGRLPEAQQVLSMFKEEEYFDFVRRDAGEAGRLTTRASFTVVEEPSAQKYQEISGRLAAMGQEMSGLRERARKRIITLKEGDRLFALSQEIDPARRRFMQSLSELLEGLKRVKPERLQELGGKTLKALTSLKGTLSALGQGAVLVHYLITAEKVKILLTTPGVQMAQESVIPEAALGRKIFAYREILTDPRRDPLPLAQELYGILLQPIEAALKQEGAQTLMLSLDGVLRYLPFVSLHDGSHYVAERYRTAVFTDAARDKIGLMPNPDWRIAGLGVSQEIAGFKALPAVKQELMGIVKEDPASESGVLPGEIYLDEAFTEMTLKRMIEESRYPVVHIASHFVFQPGRSLESYFLLGDGSHLTLEEIKREAYDFHSVELLTLSACETGMVDEANGSEVEGFGALAQNQGAKAVLATLWSVADQSTGIFMQHLYREHGKDKISKAEALQRAQAAFIRGTQANEAGNLGERGTDRPLMQADGAKAGSYRPDPQAPYAHPHYWAPFILIGNWR